MRRFRLIRHQDVSGVSGTGAVAEGVEFSSGQVSMQWLGDYQHVNHAPSVDSVVAVHGHGGSTVVQWVDEAPAAQGEVR